MLTFFFVLALLSTFLAFCFGSACADILRSAAVVEEVTLFETIVPNIVQPASEVEEAAPSPAKRPNKRAAKPLPTEDDDLVRTIELLHPPTLQVPDDVDSDEQQPAPKRPSRRTKQSAAAKLTSQV